MSDQPTYRELLPKVAKGMLLNWQKLPELLEEAVDAVLNAVWPVLYVIICLLMPFFTWASPLVTLLAVRNYKREAEARDQAVAEFRRRFNAADFDRT